MPKNTPPRKEQNRVPRPQREAAPAEPREGERVAKVIARHGLGSRREIEEWILAGRVAVNGEVLESPARVVTPEDAITVDGTPLPAKERTRLFLYHKPRGVVTTNYDPEGRATLFEILPQGLPRLVSVGRLDLNTEGLILLTNDGGLSRVLELPDTGWLRRYRVRAKGMITQDKLDALIDGVTIEGVHYGPIEAKLDRVQGANSWLTLALREGKNREVRNVLGALGLDVNRLIRLSYGPFQLGEIAQGAIEEVRTRVLADQLGETLAAAAGADFEGPLFDHAEAEEAPGRGAVKGGGLKGGKNARYAKTEGSEDRHRRRPIDTEESSDRSVTSGMVADRKGRKVLVQRVRSNEAEVEEERPVRPARGTAERTASRPTSRPPQDRGRERGGERTFRKRPDLAEAPFEAGEERPISDRKPSRERKPSRDRAAAGPRPSRPRFERSDDERGASEEKTFRPRNDRPAGPPAARPRTERGAQDSRSSDRRLEDRPKGDRFKSDRPQRERPQGERPHGDRFARGERAERPPFRERGPRPEGRAEGEGRSFRPRPEGDRPFRERGERTERAPRQDRPSRPDRPDGARPYRGASSDRPFSGRVKSEQHRARPQRSEEGGAPRGERPARPPFRERGPRPEGRAEGEGRSFRPRPEGDRPFRERGERPDRPPRRERPEGGAGEKRGFGDRPDRAERPQGRPGGARGGKPGGGRPFGKGPGGGRGAGGKGPGGKGPGGKGPGGGGRPGRPPRG
ncbi:pseudouridine synthase [Ancylobacter pratisalsi]|uniref:Pseudouridine synthase n=1 Tax=Ancylobacter pratisalsi TaxID=1745854 RepID=A0A6P1YNY5_9HYPH|nr:pseudouridine synthase [Ancylobacter pratisalsi]QIB33923.1 pseudouridine synthase [Ancylobacter pratisalsi]